MATSNAESGGPAAGDSGGVPAVAPGTLTKLWQLFRSEPQSHADSLSATSSWREITVDAARDCAVRADTHQRSARHFLYLGLVTALAGLATFLVLIAGYEWFTLNASTQAMRGLKQDKQAIEMRLRSIEDMTFDEFRRKQALGEVEANARATGQDPTHLAALKEQVDRALEAIAKSDKHRNEELSRHIQGFQFGAEILRLLTEGDEKFYWHRDLLPLARSVSVLFFVEVLAGFLLSLSRRQEALSLYWTKQRRERERLLALPGLLTELQKGKVAISADILSLLAPADESTSATLTAANPTLEALADLQAVTKKATG